MTALDAFLQQTKIASEITLNILMKFESWRESIFPEMLEPPYYIDYSELRLMIHSMVTSKYFDLAISAVIGLNVITMAMEFYMMPRVRSLFKWLFIKVESTFLALLYQLTKLLLLIVLYNERNHLLS